MNFLKALFGVKDETPEDKKKNEETKNFEILKYDGIKAMHSDRPEYAVKCFSHALNIHDDPEIRDYLSRIFIHTGNTREAMSQLEKLSGEQPDNMEIKIRMAQTAYLAEDYDTMCDICEEALTTDNGNYQIMYLYAQALIGTGDTSKAVEQLTNAIEQNKSYGDAYLLRGETLLKGGNTAEAGKDALWLLEHAPENEDVLLLKARIDKADNRISEAICYYNKVTDINPFCAAAYRERGELKISSGDESSGQADIKQADELEAGMSCNDKGQDMENKVKEAYKSIDPYGVF